jgi:hypothetical protein
MEPMIALHSSKHKSPRNMLVYGRKRASRRSIVSRSGVWYRLVRCLPQVINFIVGVTLAGIWNPSHASCACEYGSNTVFNVHAELTKPASACNARQEWMPVERLQCTARMDACRCSCAVVERVANSQVGPWFSVQCSYRHAEGCSKPPH